jgi:putative component of membrane protein insertase Oxa1/YidC/SpoIIIJ protein YidD
MGMVLSSTCRADELGSPWEVKKASYTIQLKDNRPAKSFKKRYETNPSKLPFLWGLRFYSNVISPIDGDKCGMYPTCAGYGRRAIKKHGAAVGLMMTVDRLFHEGSEMEHAPLVEKFGRIRYYDPVHNNDFWFTREDDPA